MKDLFSLAGKTALVTGGSAGIGAMIAEGFITFGAKVYIVARREDALRKKKEELARLGPCEYIPADVSSLPGIKALAAAYGEREKSLDILVNDAGVSDGIRQGPRPKHQGTSSTSLPLMAAASSTRRTTMPTASARQA